MATTKKKFFEFNNIKKKYPNIVLAFGPNLNIVVAFGQNLNIVLAFGQNNNIVLPPAKLNIVLPPAKPWNIVLPPAKLWQYSFGSGQTRYNNIFFPPVFIK